MKKPGLVAAMGFAIETVRKTKQNKKNKEQVQTTNGGEGEKDICTTMNFNNKEKSVLLLNDTERTATTSNIERCEPRNAVINLDIKNNHCLQERDWKEENFPCLEGKFCKRRFFLVEKYE